MTDGPRTETDRLLSRAAERAAADPFYLAHALRAYQAAETLDDAALAAWLGCPAEDLARLALCRRPGALFPPASPDYEEAFVEEVKALSDRFGVDAGRLAGVLRRTAFLEATAQTPAGESVSAYLMAARDRDNATLEQVPPETGADEGKDAEQ